MPDDAAEGLDRGVGEERARWRIGEQARDLPSGRLEGATTHLPMIDPASTDRSLAIPNFRGVARAGPGLA